MPSAREQPTLHSSLRHRSRRQQIGAPRRSAGHSLTVQGAGPEPTEPLYYATLDTPLGPLLVVAGPHGLKLINFQAGNAAIALQPQWLPAQGAADAPAALSSAVRQLEEYFAGQRRRFDLPLDPDGPPFMQQVWAALREIPYGETISYAELARRIGRPTATRAVGMANGRNPLPIVVPCHRVIGSDGTLTGYFGGVHLKAWLLELEGAGPAQPAQLPLV